MTETVHTSDHLQTAVALGGVEALENYVGKLPKGAEHHLWAVKQGAECWRCPLLACRRGPVPPTYPSGTDNLRPVDVLVIAEAPGKTEVEQGQTLCLEEDTVFLTADLRWKRLGDAVPGDTVIGVEETPSRGAGVSGKTMRKWRVGTIEAVHKRAASCLEVVTPNGTLRGTPDHVVMVRGGGYRPKWVSLDKLVTGRAHKSHLYFCADPWQPDKSYDAGWFAGFLDGEGCVQGSASTRVRGAGRVIYTQNAGQTLDNAVRIAHALGFDDRPYATPRSNKKTGQKCHRRYIAGGVVETMRLLGKVRPVRLLEHFTRVLPRTSIRDLVKSPVTAIRQCGIRNVVDIKTTIGTFVANGFIVHNCGASGKEVKKALADAGAPMDKIGYTNACLCMPEGNMKNYLRIVKKQGKASPIDCCRPRLKNELTMAKYLLLMGNASLEAVGLDEAVMTVRGTPLEVDVGPGLPKTPALAIPHAAFILRDEGRVFRPLFHADVRKAVRLAYQGSTWREPYYFVPKNAEEVANFLAVKRDRVAVDVETDGIDAWTCGLRRVGIGTDTEVMIHSPKSVHGHYMFERDNLIAQTRAIADYFVRQGRYDLHNGLAFDSIVLYRHGMPLIDQNIFDTLTAHQIGNTSELPHGLDFLGSVYTDARYWKEDVKHSNVRDDAVLNRYLSYDVAVTYLSAPWVQYNLEQAQQSHVYRIDHEQFIIGRSMSALGIGVDPQRRWEFAVEYQDKSNRLLQEFISAAGREINPGSYKQIQQLLYRDLGLPMLEEHFTSTGEPSTDESTLLDLLALGVDTRATNIIRALIGYREAEKILGTFIGRPTANGIEGGPIVHADGRLRAVWRPGKRSGRWGSSEPNMQNIIKRLRAMYVAAPGNIFVAADMSAVELRMIALLAGDGPLIQAFADFDAGTGPDVHTFNACTVFKCTADQVTPKVRDMIKRFVYGLSYDAQPPTIYQTLSLLRDDNLQPLFPNVTLAEVERLFATWWQLHPAVPAWKRKLIQGWRQTGFIATQWHQRKRFFIGGEKAEEMGNHPIQGSSADMQNDAIPNFVRAYPFDYARNRGLVVNGHDQLVAECAEGEAEDVKKLVNRVMERRVGPMLFPAKPVAAHDWKAVS